MTASAMKILAGLLLAMPLASALAVERSNEADALALMKKAQDYIKANGVDKAFAEFNNLQSPFNSVSDMNRHGDLYLYTTDQKGYQAVHGKNPKIRGKVMLDMKDVDGVPLIRELVKKCFDSPEGKGWVDYHWPNPVSKNVEAKKGYIERIPGTDMCLGTGIYK
ncbi:cytochrome c [Oxalobacteraceae bacterium GrIS 1.11]